MWFKFTNTSTSASSSLVSASRSRCRMGSAARQGGTPRVSVTSVRNSATMERRPASVEAPPSAVRMEWIMTDVSKYLLSGVCGKVTTARPDAGIRSHIVTPGLAIATTCVAHAHSTQVAHNVPCSRAACGRNRVTVFWQQLHERRQHTLRSRNSCAAHGQVFVPHGVQQRQHNRQQYVVLAPTQHHLAAEVHSGGSINNGRCVGHGWSHMRRVQRLDALDGGETGQRTQTALRIVLLHLFRVKSA